MSEVYQSFGPSLIKVVKFIHTFPNIPQIVTTARMSKRAKFGLNFRLQFSALVKVYIYFALVSKGMISKRHGAPTTVLCLPKILMPIKFWGGMGKTSQSLLRVQTSRVVLDAMINSRIL